MLYSKILVLLVFVFLIGITNALAQEVTQYYLKVYSNPNVLFIGGSGFYDESKSVTLETIPEVWQDYVFIGWKVDGLWSNQNPPTIVMSRSHDVEAVFEKQTGIGKIIIDTIPRISDITVDGTIYLPDELPLSFDWAEGSEHTIVVLDVVKQTPNTRYKLDSWKDQSTDTIRTITVGPDASKFIAIYKTQHYLKPITQYGTVMGGGWQDQGSSVGFELESDVMIDQKNENIRYVFNSWDLGDYLNSPTNIIDVEEPIAVKANWDEQFKLELQTNIPDYNIFGTGWYAKDRLVALIAEESLESPNLDIRYVFDRWVSKGPNPVIIPNSHLPATTVTMIEPYVIQAVYKKAYLVNVWTPFGSAIGAGYYPEGDIAEIGISATEVVVDPNKIKKIFSGWDSGSARTMSFNSEDPELAESDFAGVLNLQVFVDKPTNVTAKWKTQYYLNVESAEGTVEGSGWYDVGKFVPIAAKIPSVPAGIWSTQVFDKWEGDIDSDSMKTRILMNGPKTVLADWREDNTPGIINSIVLGGVAVVGFVIYTKSRGGTLSLHNGKNKSSKLQEKPFENFFNTRSRSFESSEKTDSIISNVKGGKSILDWLFGRG